MKNFKAMILLSKRWNKNEQPFHLDVMSYKTLLQIQKIKRHETEEDSREILHGKSF